jgi:hypothetical protein
MRQYRSRQGGKLWEELTAAEHQKFPGDYEAQTGQGAITSHAEENLTTTDQGFGMLRHLLRRQLEVIAKGGDPVGVSFDQNAPAVKFDAGRELRDAAE